MSYQVIARKWRPQSFEDVVGQKTVTQTLENALKSGRIAHAFLFSGVRGVGKTTVARILAKALNCREGISERPCDKCVSCDEIKNGNSVDVQEIDAASNRGIDNIRELRESVRYGTSRDRFKIFIIDEVHMLTNEAFNALLKTLEEPPPHVKFIMATTEFHKIPVTIASRCQKYEFKPIPFSAIFDRLRLITDAEGVQITDFGLATLATVAQGSMRDAQSALDQILAFSGTSVQDEDLKALLGVVDLGIVFQLIDLVCNEDRKGIVAAVTELLSSGISPQILCGKLVDHVRNLMVCKAAGWDEALLQLPDSEKEALLSQEKRFSELDLIRFYDTLNRTSNELRWHMQPAVHLEMALLKLIEVGRLRKIEEVIGDLESGSTPSVPRPSLPDGGTASTRTVFRPVKITPKTSVQPTGESPELDLEVDSVQKLMEVVQKDFRGLYERLKSASKLSFKDGKLRIDFPANEAFHAQAVEQTQNLTKLSETLASIVGSSVRVDVKVENGPTEVPEPPPDPREDPRVQSFLSRFPGRLIVKRDIEDN